MPLLALDESARSYARCWDAVGRDGEALLYVPVALRDAALCGRAVDADPRAFAHIPYATQSADLFWRALLPLYDRAADETVVLLANALAPHLRTQDALQAMIDIAPAQRQRILRSTDHLPRAGDSDMGMGM